MSTKKKVISKSSKQVAKSLGLSNADAIDWEIRYNITNKIIEIVEKKALTVTQVAKMAGTSRARITKILKGDSIGISLDVLVKIVASLGQEVKINFKKSA